MITNKILGIYWNGQELVVPMWLRIFVVILCLLVVVILFPILILFLILSLVLVVAYLLYVNFMKEGRRYVW